jgi:hypothetical protein
MSRMRGRRLVIGGAVAAALCVSSGGADGAGPLTLNVTFFANDSIAVTLPNGTSVGSTSGPPTVIPAGFYTVQLSGPMGLPAGLPIFHLSGPGVDLMSNLNEGGVDSAMDQASFAPSSSYTWTDDAIPGVVHTFATSADIGGTAPAAAVSPHKGAPTQDQDIVGSAVAPTRGTLTATVSPAGRPSVALDGSTVSRLLAGSYRIAVTDHNPTAGLVVTKTGQRPRSLSGAAYVGRRSVSVKLTPGRWTFTSRVGQKSGYSIVVQ